MASPRYDAKYRRHDDAPGRVVPAPLLAPDARASALDPTACSGELVVGDEQYEPWGTPHGGVIAELAARCMGVQAIVALGAEPTPVLLTSHHAFRRRWTRGETLRWSTELIAADATGSSRAAPDAAAGTEAPHPLCSVEARLSMGERVVTQSTATFLMRRMRAVDASAPVPESAAAACAYLDALAARPFSDRLYLPVHHGGWSAGSIEGHFDVTPSSLFVALDEALAAAANTVRGDAHGDDVAEDFLLADMSVTAASSEGTTSDTAPDQAVTEFRSSIRRGRSGADGLAHARLVRAGRVIAYGHGRVAFLHRD